MEEFGMIYDTLMNIAQVVSTVSDTMDTIKTICDAVEIALAAASAIPGAAAFTGPVISLYESIKPALSTVIELTQMVSEFLNIIVQIVQALDALAQGKWQELLNMGVSAWQAVA